jgi:hypothetical protein
MQEQYNKGDYAGALGSAAGFVAPLVAPEAAAAAWEKLPAAAKSAASAVSNGTRGALETFMAASDPRRLLKLVPKGQAAVDAFDAVQAERAAARAARTPAPPPNVIRESPAWADIQPSPAAATDFSPIPAEGLPSGRVPGSLARAEAARATEAEAAATPEVNRDVIDERPDARTVTEPAATLPEPWQVPKSEIIDYRDTRPQRTAAAAPETGGYTEAEMHARTLENRANEDTPPTFNRYPVGTYAKDSDGELLQLRRYPLDDPKLIFPEGMPHPGNQTVQKYVDWIGQGSEPPPLTGIETEAGNIKIQEGHHRAEAIRQTGGNAADVWVNLTHNRPIGNGQVMGEGVTHEGAVRRALDAGETVPAAVLNDYPALMAKANPAQISAEPAAAEPASDLEQQLRASIDLANARRAGTPALTPAQILEDHIDKHSAYLANQAEDIVWANRARKADRIAQHLIENNLEATPDNIATAARQLDEARPPSEETIPMIQDRVDWHNARMAQVESGSAGQPAAAGTAGEVDAGTTGEVDAGTTGIRPPVYESNRPGARKIRAAGDGTTVETPGESHTYPGRYEVRELSEVQPSHNPHNFNRNPRYEYENDRNYDDPENQRKIIDWSQGSRFRPRNLLNTAPDASSGPPIIDGDGNVLGGNGRTMILGRVYENNPAGAAAYRAELDRTAAHYGIDPESYAYMKQPVLVRRVEDGALETPEAAQKAITDFNKAGTAALTPAERAIADARRVSTATLEDISKRMDAIGPDATLAQALEGKSGGEVLARLMDDGVISPQEGAQLRRGGALTRSGQERVSGLMLGRFFSNAKQLDSIPDALRGKMERLAAPLARVEGNADYSLSPQIRRALDLTEDAAAHDMTLDDFTRQSNFFASHNYPPDVVVLAKNLQKRNPVALTQAVRNYAERAKYAEEFQGSGMFGEFPPPVSPGAAFRENFSEEAMAKEAADAAAKKAEAAAKKKKTGTE